MKQRIVQPELLDELSPDHPDALRNRRDLRMINRLQGNFRWIARQVSIHVQPGESIIEPGAGQGDLAFYLRQQTVLSSKSLGYAGLDLWPMPTGWDANWAWHQEDLLTFERYGEYPVFVANFILHQFEDDDLRKLGEKLRQSARVIIASETLRVPRAKGGLLFLNPLMNHVSRHDAKVSIEGGFRGNELGELFGLTGDQWYISVVESLLGTYRFCAIRREES